MRSNQDAKGQMLHEPHKRWHAYACRQPYDFVSVYLLVVMTASIEMSFMWRWFLFFVVGGSSAGIASFFYELLSGESVD